MICLGSAPVATGLNISTEPIVMVPTCRGTRGWLDRDGLAAADDRFKIVDLLNGNPDGCLFVKTRVRLDESFVHVLEEA